MNLAEIFVSQKPEGTDKSLEFLGRAENSEVPLTLYENVLINRGELGTADDAYAMMRNKRRKEAVQNAKSVSQKCGAYLFYALDTVQRVLLGYGRFPAPPLLWSLCFVVLGTVLFRRRDSMQATNDSEITSYSPFWYSLEFVLPVVDLGVAKNWRRATSRAAGICSSSSTRWLDLDSGFFSGPHWRYQVAESEVDESAKDGCRASLKSPKFAV